MAFVQQVPPIAAGYPYAIALDVSADSDPFPNGCVLRAEVRAFAGGPLAGVLSTADGSIVVTDDHNAELHISAAVTAALTGPAATIDIARLSPAPETWLGIVLTLPVVAPVTLP